MTKYTNLEQASHDPSLAIITDRITTQRELNRIYARYEVLSKKQKRYSNYYSNEFLGRRVTEMYILMKEKLRIAGDSSEEMLLPKDALVISEPDLYYKEESFNKGDTNLCFILGHSGSGKSRMASTLEGDKIDHIELDDILLIKDHFSMDALKAYSDMYYSFFGGEKPAAAAPQRAKPSGVSYRVGDTVRSKVFGEGVVLSVKPMGGDSLLEIAFATAGTKKLMANYAKLEKLSS